MAYHVTSHSPQINFRRLKYDLLKSGATLVGYGDVSEGLAKELKHLPYAISIAVNHPAISLVSEDQSGEFYSNQYPQIDLKLEFLQEITKKNLRQHGWKYILIPADSNRSDKRFIAKVFNLFSHKTAATCAGLGWIGKNGLLVNEKHGARLSWATVLTDAPLPVDAPIKESICGSCQRCVNACPANAIKGIKWVRGLKQQPVDYEKCKKYLLELYHTYEQMVCGRCILSCCKGSTI
jgi:epoxyqueuosine reductase QueG